ncbi:DUF397 domain-containing protein [Kitasatospora purpeofusca]|uniref:DUF397 domain-containing protein n=1 Tax=Kitasatospora purpeofusca TaxID=67352 RepID=UPI0038692C31
MSEQDWQKSSFSGSGNDCVEVRSTNGLIELRESDDGDIILCAASADFAEFLYTIRVGELDRHS